VPDVIALIVGIVYRKDLKIATVISSPIYVDKIKEAGLTNETMPLIGEDVERLKCRNSLVAGVVVMPITLSAIGCLMMNGIQSITYVSDIMVKGAIVLGILLCIVTAVVVYRLLKQNNDWTDYTKRRGVCLDLEVTHFGVGVKKNVIYYATVGYISDDSAPIVFRLRVTCDIYYAMRYAKGWFVVVGSNNRNMNVISEKSLDEMVREDRANGIERHMTHNGVFSGFYD
jgi:hypothetical protein